VVLSHCLPGARTTPAAAPHRRQAAGHALVTYRAPHHRDDPVAAACGAGSKVSGAVCWRSSARLPCTAARSGPSAAGPEARPPGAPATHPAEARPLPVHGHGPRQRAAQAVRQIPSRPQRGTRSNRDARPASARLPPRRPDSDLHRHRLLEGAAGNHRRVRPHSGAARAMPLQSGAARCERHRVPARSPSRSRSATCLQPRRSAPAIRTRADEQASTAGRAAAAWYQSVFYGGGRSQDSEVNAL
jgi:hypothetical protein